MARRTPGRCLGHASTDGPIGHVVYCDGTCRPAYQAGILSGHEIIVRSWHSTRELAVRAAEKYARERMRNGPQTGGAGAWSGYWRRTTDAAWTEVRS